MGVQPLDVRSLEAGGEYGSRWNDGLACASVIVIDDACVRRGGQAGESGGPTIDTPYFAPIAAMTDSSGGPSRSAK